MLSLRFDEVSRQFTCDNQRVSNSVFKVTRIIELDHCIACFSGKEKSKVVSHGCANRLYLKNLLWMPINTERVNLAVFSSGVAVEQKAKGCQISANYLA